MDKVILKENSLNVKAHQFYCDGCNRLLGESEEKEDGTYESVGEYNLKLHLIPSGNGGWFHINGHYCNACRGKMIRKIEKGIINLGFDEGFDE